MSTFDIQPQVEEQYDSQQEETLREMGTAYAEPASEDQYVGWPGDGSGMDDLQDLMQNEAADYYGD